MHRDRADVGTHQTGVRRHETGAGILAAEHAAEVGADPEPVVAGKARGQRERTRRRDPAAVGEHARVVAGPARAAVGAAEQAAPAGRPDMVRIAGFDHEARATEQEGVATGAPARAAVRAHEHRGAAREVDPVRIRRCGVEVAVEVGEESDRAGQVGGRGETRTPVVAAPDVGGHARGQFVERDVQPRRIRIREARAHRARRQSGRGGRGEARAAVRAQVQPGVRAHREELATAGAKGEVEQVVPGRQGETGREPRRARIAAEHLAHVAGDERGTPAARGLEQVREHEGEPGLVPAPRQPAVGAAEHAAAGRGGEGPGTRGVGDDEIRIAALRPGRGPDAGTRPGDAAAQGQPEAGGSDAHRTPRNAEGWIHIRNREPRAVTGRDIEGFQRSTGPDAASTAGRERRRTIALEFRLHFHGGWGRTVAWSPRRGMLRMIARSAFAPSSGTGIPRALPTRDPKLTASSRTCFDGGGKASGSRPDGARDEACERRGWCAGSPPPIGALRVSSASESSHAHRVATPGIVWIGLPR
jgi:hypothetical protein